MPEAQNVHWWIAGLILFSFFLLLLIVYLRGSYRQGITYTMKNVPEVDKPHFSKAMMAVSLSILSQGYVTGFWFDMNKINEARLDAIRRAKRTIHLETFFVTPGKRTEEFANALIEQAQAGVKVKIIVDSFGSLKMPMDYWKRLREKGVQVRFFHKLNWRDPLTYNIRTHRKLLLIDGELALMGGMGISDYWDGCGGTKCTAPWLDVEVAFQGSIVLTLESIFMQHWIDGAGAVDLSQDLLDTKLSGGSTILVTPTSPPGESSPISRLFYANILAAKERIWIASPYFLCDSNSERALIEASQKGIDVRIVTVGPCYDHKYIYLAARELYRQWLEAGIKIYEYLPNMMHAKVLLVDHAWVNTGSTNFDPRSFFHNAELNISMYDPAFTKLVDHFFVWAFEQSNCLTLEEWENRSWWERIQGRLALFVRWQL